MKKIVVIGSLNMDCVIETPHMPHAGETVSGRSVSLIPGGKGANQAYAAGILGGNVAMIGAVGDDGFGETLKSSLDYVGVDTSSISVIQGETTGQAFITVDDRGENAIIIIAGTNGLVKKELVQKYQKQIEDSDIVIMQLEIPLETVQYVKNLAVSLGKTVILDPAPAIGNLPEGFFGHVDYIKPNETELEILTGTKMETQEELAAGARKLLSQGVKNVIVSLGEKGCLLVSEKEETFFPARKVKALDTTAAGDSFTAAFALALSEGKSCHEAIRFGQKVSSVVVTRKGAQTSIPTREEVDGLQ